ncbi:MAG: hypothetical protein U0Y82_16870 [Thermoleophilia bacterium]
MPAITIRDVPPQVRDELAARAARSGRSLQQYVRRMLIEAVEQPSIDDALARARARIAAGGGTRLTAEQLVALTHADRR